MNLFIKKFQEFLKQPWQEDAETYIVDDICEYRHLIVANPEKGQDYLKRYKEKNQNVILMNTGSDFQELFDELLQAPINESRQLKEEDENLFRPRKLEGRLEKTYKKLVDDKKTDIKEGLKWMGIDNKSKSILFNFLSKTIKVFKNKFDKYDVNTKFELDEFRKISETSLIFWNEYIDNLDKNKDDLDIQIQLTKDAIQKAKEIRKEQNESRAEENALKYKKNIETMKQKAFSGISPEKEKAILDKYSERNFGRRPIVKASLTILKKKLSPQGWNVILMLISRPGAGATTTWRLRDLTELFTGQINSMNLSKWTKYLINTGDLLQNGNKVLVNKNKKINESDDIFKPRKIEQRQQEELKRQKLERQNRFQELNIKASKNNEFKLDKRNRGEYWINEFDPDRKILNANKSDFFSLLNNIKEVFGDRLEPINGSKIHYGSLYPDYLNFICKIKDLNIPVDVPKFAELLKPLVRKLNWDFTSISYHPEREEGNMWITLSPSHITSEGNFLDDSDNQEHKYQESKKYGLKENKNLFKPRRIEDREQLIKNEEEKLNKNFPVGSIIELIINVYYNNGKDSVKAKITSNIKYNNDIELYTAHCNAILDFPNQFGNNGIYRTSAYWIENEWHCPDNPFNKRSRYQEITESKSINEGLNLDKVSDPVYTLGRLDEYFARCPNLEAQNEWDQIKSGYTNNASISWEDYLEQSNSDGKDIVNQAKGIISSYSLQKDFYNYFNLKEALQKENYLYRPDDDHVYKVNLKANVYGLNTDNSIYFTDSSTAYDYVQKNKGKANYVGLIQEKTKPGPSLKQVLFKLENKLKNFDWYYMMNDNDNDHNSYEEADIRKLVNLANSLSGTHQGDKLYDKYCEYPGYKKKFNEAQAGTFEKMGMTPFTEEEEISKDAGSSMATDFGYTTVRGLGESKNDDFFKPRKIEDRIEKERIKNEEFKQKYGFLPGFLDTLFFIPQFISLEVIGQLVKKIGIVRTKYLDSKLYKLKNFNRIHFRNNLEEFINFCQKTLDSDTHNKIFNKNIQESISSGNPHLTQDSYADLYNTTPYKMELGESEGDDLFKPRRVEERLSKFKTVLELLKQIKPNGVYMFRVYKKGDNKNKFFRVITLGINAEQCKFEVFSFLKDEDQNRYEIVPMYSKISQTEEHFMKVIGEHIEQTEQLLTGKIKAFKK